jgi:branched-chain amino acid transport system permease protein
MIAGGAISGLIGFGTGYLTLRLKGAFFSIATLAMAVVMQTLVINWDFVGGSRGAYIIRPASLNLFGYELPYIQYLFVLMLVLALIAVVAARTIEGSKFGYGLATIRDDELAAEACGVPTLRLKLIATTLSGAFMGMAGAPFPYYIGYIEPASAFGLAYAVNAIAMPMIGGTTSWLGPVIGAVLLGTLQQVATVTISSAVNLLLVGVLLVAFVIIAPNGLVGMVQNFVRAASPAGPDGRSIGVIAIAIYAFVAGVIGIVISATLISLGGATWITLGLLLLALSVLYGAAAYGLLTIHGWALWLTVGVLAVSVPAAAFNISQDIARWPHAISIAVSVVAIAFLVRESVRRLYGPVRSAAA